MTRFFFSLGLITRVLMSVLVGGTATAPRENVCAPRRGLGVPVSVRCAPTTAPAMATVMQPQDSVSAGKAFKVCGFGLLVCPIADEI